jgi:hypothetical protein
MKEAFPVTSRSKLDGHAGIKMTKIISEKGTFRIFILIVYLRIG